MEVRIPGTGSVSRGERRGVPEPLRVLLPLRKPSLAQGLLGNRMCFFTQEFLSWKGKSFK